MTHRTTHRWTTSLAAAALLGLATAASADIGSAPAAATGTAPVPSVALVGPTIQPPVTTLDIYGGPVRSIAQPHGTVVDSSLWASPTGRSGTRMKMLASPPIGNGALVLGIGAGAGRRRQAGIAQSFSFDRSAGGTRRIEFGWLSNAGWRLTTSWTSTSGSGHRSGSRLIDLASGARPRENGARVTLALADRSHAMAYGLTGGSATLNATDAHDLGRGNDRHDAHASLFWLARF